MKKKIAALAVIAIALSLVAYGTVAFFSAEDEAHNVLTMGGIDIALADKTLVDGVEKDFTTVYPDGMKVMPAIEADKLVYVTNTCAEPCYVRVRIEKSVEPAEASLKLDPDQAILNYDTEHWVNGGDGFWYYKTELAPGASTEKLFTKVLFDPKMDNDYQGCKFLITVGAQAVQAANNRFDEATQTVLDVNGWPAVIE